MAGNPEGQAVKRINVKGEEVYIDANINNSTKIERVANILKKIHSFEIALWEIKWESNGANESKEDKKTAMNQDNKVIDEMIKEAIINNEENEDFSKPWHEYIGLNSWYGSSYFATRHFKDKDEKIEVIYGPGCTIRKVTLESKGYCGKYDDLSIRFFDGLWFDFPTPFKKGDIVHMVYDDPDGEWAYRFCHGGMVLQSLLPWNLDEERKKSYLEVRNGDTSDMSVYGFFISENGQVSIECTYNYMDLEYYDGPYKGMRRILKPLSNYIKGEIDIELFLYAYRIFVLEQNLETIKKDYDWFTDDGKRLAGLLDDGIDAES